MKCIAIGDIHLGYRRHPATTPDGRNAREVDIEYAWHRVVDEVVERRPDLVTIAGDVFHHPRVGMRAVKAWRVGIARMLEAGAYVVALVGNHDAPRTSDALTPVVIPDDFDRMFVCEHIQRVGMVIGGRTVVVTAVPHAPVGSRDESFELRPLGGGADVNILVIHGAVRTSELPHALPPWYGGEDALDVSAIADEWAAIHCGDLHAFTPLHPSRPVFYAGAPERTTSDVWAEADSPRGFVLYDPDAGTTEHVQVPGRRIVDIGWPANRTPSAENVNAALAHMLAVPENIVDAVVRLRVDGIPREDRQAIDWAVVRALKACALHFEPDFRYRAPVAEVGPGRDRAGALTLIDEAEREFAGDPELVRETALAYITGAIEEERAEIQR